MAYDDTPPIRTFDRLLQYARPGRILTTGFGAGNVYPEWSEGNAASGSIVAFNGERFVAMTVGQAAIAAGESFTASGGLTFADADPRYVNASGDVMQGQLTQPLSPTASGHLVNKSYADSLVSGGEAFLFVSSNALVSDVNTVVFVNSDIGSIGITLPNPHTAGRKITVKDFGTDGDGNTEANPVRVYPGGSEKIEGVASGMLLVHNKESATFVGNGTDWGRI